METVYKTEIIFLILIMFKFKNKLPGGSPSIPLAQMTSTSNWPLVIKRLSFNSAWFPINDNNYILRVIIATLRTLIIKDLNGINQSLFNVQSKDIIDTNEIKNIKIFLLNPTSQYLVIIIIYSFNYTDAVEKFNIFLLNNKLIINE